MPARLPNSKTVIARLALDAPMVLESAGMSRGQISALQQYRQADHNPTPIETAALAAVLSGDQDVALGKITYCPNPNAADNLGVTLLHHAAQMGMQRVCELLLARGANRAAVTALGETVVGYAIACNANPGHPRNHLPGMLTFLFNNGVQPDQPDAVDKALPEHIAARLGDTSALAVLYRALGGFQKKTLVLAALSEQTQPVRFLLWAGTDPRADLKQKTWPRGAIKSMISTETRHGKQMGEICSILARAEAIAYARQRAGLSVGPGIDLTQVPNLRRELQDVALIMRGHDDTQVYDQSLLLLGEMKGYRPALHRSPQAQLFLAAATNNVPSLVDALAKGAQPDQPNEYGRTAYNVAATRESLAVMETLRRVGADPDFPDVLERTPLMQNALAGNVMVVGKLLGQGANPLLTDYAGKTARQLVGELVDHLEQHDKLEDGAALEYIEINRLLELAEAKRQPTVRRRPPAARQYLH